MKWFSHWDLSKLTSVGTALPVLAVVMLVGLVLIFVASRLSRRLVKHNVALYGLYGVVGRMGGGKSYFLTHQAVEASKNGRKVYANFPLNLPNSVLVSCWQDITDAELGSLVIIDEAHLWWSSSDHKAPVEVKSWISQLRKRRITCFWASQSVLFVAKWLRELHFGVWECQRYKAGHQYTLYEPHFGESKALNRPKTARMYLVRRKRVMKAYDTVGIVNGSREWGDGTEPVGVPSLRGAHLARSRPVSG